MKSPKYYFSKLRFPKHETESHLKRRICDWLAIHNCFFWIESTTGIYDPVHKCYRRLNSPYAMRGKADIIGIWKGRPLAIEVKVRPNRLTEEQKKFLENFSSHGGIVIVAYTLDDVIKELQNS